MEDNAALARSLTLVLEGCGASVVVTRRIARALDLMSQVHFMLTDYHLEGEGTAKQLVMAAANLGLPCVVYSGLAHKVPREVRELAPVLEKPVELDVLEATILQFFAR